MALQLLASDVLREPAFYRWNGSVGQFIRELLFRDLSWYEERDLLHKQALPVRTYKTLKRFDLEERERAYWWIAYKVP